MKEITHRFASASAMLLIAGSATFATHYGTGDRQRSDAPAITDRAEFWQARANGCALGNDPPPGTNCSR